MDDCIFCKIVKGDIPCYKIWEDEKYLAFLDAFPSMKGQTLVIPKEHSSEYLFEMDDKSFSELMLVSKKIARAIDSAINPIKTGLVVEGLEVGHVHVKLYPLNSPFGIKLLESKISAEEMKDISEKISSLICVK